MHIPPAIRKRSLITLDVFWSNLFIIFFSSCPFDGKNNPVKMEYGKKKIEHSLITSMTLTPFFHRLYCTVAQSRGLACSHRWLPCDYSICCVLLLCCNNILHFYSPCLLLYGLGKKRRVRLKYFYKNNDINNSNSITISSSIIVV